jgi:tetratricopeptide (TPR) repeat protein
VTRARALAIAVVFALAGLGGAARAQSTRYPPPPADPDADADARSSFWDAALAPGLDQYRHLLDQARRLIEQRDSEPLAQAIDLLGQATTAQPDRAEGWWYLGVAHEAREEWQACADAFGRARAIDPAFVPHPPLRARPELDHALGVCLARAGHLEDARVHLARLAQSGVSEPEVWLRLGEVYMGLGRLSDAIDALDRAAQDAAISPDVHWALAVAYDRARRDADAEDELATALRLDPQLANVASPVVPYLSEAESYYYQGLGAAAAQQPERAVVDLRRFIELAPGSPWKARAEQHLADLAATDWATRVEIVGNGAIDPAKAMAVVRAGLPKIQACAAGHPGLLVRVTITVSGPSGAGPVVGSPPPGTRATAILAFGETDDRIHAALTCIEDAAARMSVARPTQPNSFTRIAFPVVAPAAPVVHDR